MSKEERGIPYSIEECVEYKSQHLVNADPYLKDLFQWLINMATVGEQALKELRQEIEDVQTYIEDDGTYFLIKDDDDTN